MKSLGGLGKGSQNALVESAYDFRIVLFAKEVRRDGPRPFVIDHIRAVRQLEGVFEKNLVCPFGILTVLALLVDQVSFGTSFLNCLVERGNWGIGTDFPGHRLPVIALAVAEADQCKQEERPEEETEPGYCPLMMKPEVVAVIHRDSA